MHIFNRNFFKRTKKHQEIKSIECSNNCHPTATVDRDSGTIFEPFKINTLRKSTASQKKPKLLLTSDCNSYRLREDLNVSWPLIDDVLAASIAPLEGNDKISENHTENPFDDSFEMLTCGKDSFFLDETTGFSFLKKSTVLPNYKNQSLCKPKDTLKTTTDIFSDLSPYSTGAFSINYETDTGKTLFKEQSDLQMDDYNSVVSEHDFMINVISAQKFKSLCSDKAERFWETTGQMPKLD